MKNFLPKNILVTGGMGFIGSNFIRTLLGTKADVNIVNLDYCTYAASEINLLTLINLERYNFIKGDINNRHLVNNIMSEFNIDTIVHFAAESHVDKSIHSPNDFITTNIVGTFNLLESARENWLNKKKWNASDCRFYHISTDEVYGSCLTMDSPSFSELSAYKPSSPYSASKASSNHLVNSYYNTYLLPTIISNCTNNYGPHQHIEKFIPKIINCCIHGKKIPIYGNGTAIRDWLYVQDHCDAIVALLENGNIGHEYNIGANNELSNIEVVKNICKLMDIYTPKKYSHENLIMFVDDRLGHDWRYSLNCEKISTTLGWYPKTSFVSGLNQTINFYLELYNVRSSSTIVS